MTTKNKLDNSLQDELRNKLFLMQQFFVEIQTEIYSRGKEKLITGILNARKSCLEKTGNDPFILIGYDLEEMKELGLLQKESN